MEIALARVAAAFEQHAGCRTKQDIAAGTRIIPVIAVLLALLHAALAVTATIDKSPTFDELVHLTACYSRLRFARLCAYLRHREPIGNIGYSILVFRLTDKDLHDALYGPPAELAPKIEVVTR